MKLLLNRAVYVVAGIWYFIAYVNNVTQITAWR